MQIYKDMNIGTAKVTEEEMQGIPHYLIDFISPDKRYSVSEYVKDARSKIEDILNKGKKPIVVGGTGLYIESLIYENVFEEEEYDLGYRNYLNDIAEKGGLEELYNEALKIDEEAAKKISKNDKKRIIRILEIYHKTGKTKTERDLNSRQKNLKYEYKLFCIDIKRDILYNRINDRVDKMLNQGLVLEVEQILKKYREFPTAMQGLGYKEVVEYIQNKISYDEMKEKIKQETRHYAKRQLTWFRKYDQAIWLDGLNSVEENIDKILNIIDIGE